MRTIKTNFEKAGRYFMLSMQYLYEALGMSLIRLVVVVYFGMNGKFGKYRMREPYVYVWKVIAWGLFVWAVFTWIFVPFFNWWSKVVDFLNYIIWG